MIKLVLVVAALAGVIAGLGAVGVFGAPAPSAVPQAAAVQVRAQPGDQTVEITEADLNTQLNQQLAGQTLGSTPMGPATLQRLSAQLTRGVLRATGDAQVGSSSVPVTMSGTVHVDNGRAVVVLDDVRAAGMPLPASAREPVQAAVQAQVDAQVSRLNLRLKSVTIDNGTLRLVGSPP